MIYLILFIHLLDGRYIYGIHAISGAANANFISLIVILHYGLVCCEVASPLVY